MNRIILFLFVFTATLSFHTTAAQKSTQAAASNIQVIQFHNEHRCVTCLTIEKLTKATLAKSYPSIPFKLYNVDDEVNAKLAEQFEASGTALFLYNPKTGKKQDLTEFAFMKADNEAIFQTGLKTHIAAFLKN